MLIRAAHLPEPETQVWVLGYRLDLYWRHKKLAVEVDTYDTHGARAKFYSDPRRDARLRTEAGITVIRVTEEQIKHEPFVVIALIAGALGD